MTSCLHPADKFVHSYIRTNFTIFKGITYVTSIIHQSVHQSTTRRRDVEIMT